MGPLSVTDGGRTFSCIILDAGEGDERKEKQVTGREDDTLPCRC